MRVAMVSEHASPLAVLGGDDAGGQNVHVAALARALARAGADVVVHTRRDDPDLPRRVPLCPGVVVDHVDAGPAETLPKDELLPFMDAFAAELAAAWGDWRPDVAHSHFWMSGLAATDAAAWTGVPVAHTFHALGSVKRRHQGAEDPSPPQRIALERQIALRADRVVATCSDEVFELRRMGVEHGGVSIVPCGVDVDAFEPRPAPAGGVPRLLMATRLVRRKGIEDAIAALADLPDAQLHVVGGPAPEALADDPAAQQLRRIADRHHVGDRLVLRGRLDREAMPAEFAAADVVLCPAWYEPFGIVPLEAMACGRPVVASAVGGHVDSVVDGVTGLHVPPRDPAHLAGAIARLLADRDLRVRMGEAGRRRVERRFDWDRIAAATLDVYAELLDVDPLAREVGAGRFGERAMTPRTGVRP
jgi:D-inositol-3-phosphate glycosyltransferase